MEMAVENRQIDELLNAIEQLRQALVADNLYGAYGVWFLVQYLGTLIEELRVDTTTGKDDEFDLIPVDDS